MLDIIQIKNSLKGMHLGMYKQFYIQILKTQKISFYKQR